MQFIELNIKKALTPYLKENIKRQDFDNFKTNLNTMLESVKKFETNQKEEREEHLKNYLINFFKQTYYGSEYLVNTKDNIDLAIYLGRDSESNVGVIIETKRPSNTSEMFSHNKPLVKSLFEIILYYFDERENQRNNELKHLIITNFYQWYIFDANTFDKHIYRNEKIKKLYKNKIDERKDNNFFYEEIERILKDEDLQLEYIYFNIMEYETNIRNNSFEEENKLIPLYKIFSPKFLLKLRYEDPTALNLNFYNELLYILGLEEISQKNRLIIRRIKKDSQKASLIELTISQLKADPSILNKLNLYTNGKIDDEKIFNIALELCITWINRILFIKLLEGQLLIYHQGDSRYKFLAPDKIKNFGILYHLFHNVLNVNYNQRNSNYESEFNHLPYLNSSLFEISELESQTIKINQLNSDLNLNLYGRTVLKNLRRSKNKLNTIEYLLRFLNAYDFSSEGTEQIQDEHKPIINASVLGKVFEKINGYRDGSYYTPATITEFMTKESIKIALIDIFNKKFNWNANTIEDIRNYTSSDRNTNKILEYNQAFNSIRICDPAVGSGHFLVSALNHLIYMKYYLGILADKMGNVISEFEFSINNDELYITDRNGNFIEYKIKNQKPVSQKIQKLQEILFYEKQSLIENCLFGADINPNSVKIAQLRLWIELLKNAFYIPDEYKALQTLPNLDINIKCGNSLISRFDLMDSSPLTITDAKIIPDYKKAVQAYKKAKNYNEKQKAKNDISNYKNQLKGFILDRSNISLKLSKAKGKLLQLRADNTLFESLKSKKEKKEIEKEIEKLTFEIKKYEEELKNLEENPIDKNAIEWRFDFPEILDDKGNFIGFDIVIGNPPYIQLQKSISDKSELKYADLYKDQNYKTFERNGDIYCLFYEKGIQLLKNNGLLCYITSNKWMRARYGEKLRLFFTQHNPLLLIDLGPGVFENATVDTNILLIQKNNNSASPAPKKLKAVTLQKTDKYSIDEQVEKNSVMLEKLTKDAWFIGSRAEQRLKEKIERIGKPLKEWDVNIYRGVLTGLNEAFIITTEKRNEILENCRDEAERHRTEAIIKPILRGRDIKRYYYEWARLWIIFIPWHFPLHEDTSIQGASEKAEKEFQKQYPAIYNHLLEFKEPLSKRNKEETGIRYEWYALQRCAATYYPEFEKEKVVWKALSLQPSFTIVHSGVFNNDKANLLTSKNSDIKYLCGLMNSKIFQFYFSSLGIGMGEGFEYKIQFVEKIPLPPITSENQPLVRRIEALVDKILEAKRSNPQANTTNWEKKIDKRVYKLYGLTEEEIKIIENKK